MILFYSDYQEYIIYQTKLQNDFMMGISNFGLETPHLSKVALNIQQVVLEILSKCEG